MRPFMKRVHCCCGRLAACALVALTALSPAAGTELHLDVTSRGLDRIVVPPGSIVPFTVTGQLGDAGSSAGLAAFSFDLRFTGGPLSPVAPSDALAMKSFLAPRGLTNPAGFGGTPQAGALVQVGGAQNVIGNTPDRAPAPTGTVVTGLGFLPMILAVGTLQAPALEGSYALLVSGSRATVIKAGEAGDPPWRTERTQGGRLAPLLVVVRIGATLCGNRAVDPGEQCDDGNMRDGDGCSTLCQIESIVVPTLGLPALLLLAAFLGLAGLLVLRRSTRAGSARSEPPRGP